MGTLNVEVLQDEFDKRYPKGVHVWVSLGEGANPYTFLIPRVFVLDNSTILLSPMDDTMYFEVIADDVVFKDKETALIQSGTRTYQLTPATEAAQRVLGDRVKDAHRSGLVKEFRDLKAGQS